MVLFTLDRAEYALAVLKAVDRLGADAYRKLGLTEQCDECGDMPDALDADDGHVIGAIPALQYQSYVIIGCEGYWHVDPAHVGIERTNWQPPER